MCAFCSHKAKLTQISTCSLCFYFHRNKTFTMSSKRAKGKTTKKRPQRATSNVFAMFDQSQIQEFKEAFNMIDQNRDGFVDKEDLHDMLASLGESKHLSSSGCCPLLCQSGQVPSVYLLCENLFYKQAPLNSHQMLMSLGIIITWKPSGVKMKLFVYDQAVFID